MKNIFAIVALFLFCSFTLIQAGDVYKQNPYTAKLDNIGQFSLFSSNLNNTAKNFISYTSIARLTEDSAYQIFVPYSGASKNINANNRRFYINQTRFNTTPFSILSTAGNMYWNPDKGTLNLHMGYDSVIQQIGQEQYYSPVRAKTGAIGNGVVVMVDPLDVMSGERFNVLPAVSNGTYSSKLVIGMATMAIPHNQTGLITRFGEVHDLNLSALKPIAETWNEGEILWCNPAVAGGLTDTEPLSPNLKMPVAVVQKVNGNNLDLFVRFENGFTLGDLHNVNTGGAVADSILAYNGATWAPTRSPSFTNMSATRIDLTDGTYVNTITGSEIYMTNTGTNIRISPAGVTPAIRANPDLTFEIPGNDITAIEIRDHVQALVDPHPAPGSNRNVAYNNYGAWAGASLLNYSGGRTAHGTTNPSGDFHVVSQAATATRGMLLGQHNTGAQASQLQFQKSRNTFTSPSKLIANDFIGSFNASGYDGSAYQIPAAVLFQVISTSTGGGVKSGNVPAGVAFYTGTNAGNRAARVQVNPDGKVGIGTTSPRSGFDNASSAVGKANPYFGSLTNYVLLGQDLGLRYAGNTTTYDDLRIEPQAKTGAGASPTFSLSFGTSAGAGGLYSFAYVKPPAANSLEYLYYALQMPHSWKEGSTVYPHVHFATSDTSGTVKFKGTCYGANYLGTFSSFGNWSSTTTLSGAAWKHNIAVGTSIDMTGKTISTVLNCNMIRKFGDTATNPAHVQYIDYHYEVDSTGSDSEYSKTATP